MPPRPCSSAFGWASTRPTPWSPIASGFERTKLSPVTLPADPVRMISVSTTLSASEFTPRMPASRSRRPTPSSPSGTACSRRAPSCSIRRRRSIRPTGCCSAPASARSIMPWRTTATTRRQSGDRAAVAAGAAAAVARAAGDQERARGPRSRGWRRRSACGRRSRRRRPACRTGASHGIGYALGATFGVPHGHTSCVMLPAVLQWNAAVNGERQKALAAAMGAPGPSRQRAGQGADRRPRPAGHAARRRHQAREPRRDRRARAGLPPRAGQPAPDQDGRGRAWRSSSSRGSTWQSCRARLRVPGRARELTLNF